MFSLSCLTRFSDDLTTNLYYIYIIFYQPDIKKNRETGT
ncbi:Uncharacterized protein dnm_041390 [Desulfonema magnum]|uniref:Uncharacterized protein n=1 Tax=Desulfonema magnum TaxID=45655 RepID=A0A975BMV7_9BACT|nr:Uncharacterized protein dnm_041390 [Desulfonema magnum]